MAIITTAEVKTFLQITVTTYDSLIDALIPEIQQFVIDYCSNTFKQPGIYEFSSNIAFVSGSPATITDSDSKFIENDLTNAGHIIVEYSYDNDGIYEVSTVAAGTITLASGETLTNEDAATNGVSIRITKVKFPVGIKPIISRMINIHIQKALAKGVQSESLGDHSISYVGEGSYPKGLLKELSLYRKIGF